MEIEQRRPWLPLPRPLTSLIGREEISRELCIQLSDPEIRFLTLTGTGGVGKTRLALEVVHTIQNRFTDGVCFVSLSATRSPEQVIPAIAAALHCGTGSRSIFEIVQAYLRERQLLLVLDNFEQVRAAAPQISTLFTTCCHLKLLVTSREALRLPEERVFVVDPLSLPDLTTQQDLLALRHNPAVALFIERAQALKPDLDLTAASVIDIARICVHLDGLPLAIELAAARIKLLPPWALLTRLTRRLPVLTTGPRDAPARQQTLRATIRWSYDLLTFSEQTLFQRLCIFIGGCSLEAIEALTTDLDNQRSAISEQLASLQDKNLILRESQAEEEPRLLVRETIREFGLECLEASEILPQVQQAQARYYLSWSETACKSIFSQEQIFWVKRFVRELGNLRAVMLFLLKQPDRSAALYLSAQLSPIWFLWGTANQYIYMIEGKHYLEQVLAGSEEYMGWAWGRSLVLYGGILAVLREAERGASFCQQGLTFFREKHDLQSVIQSLWMSFYPCFVACNFREARLMVEEAVTHSQQHPEVCTDWGAAWTQGYSAFLAGYVAVWDGRYQEARALLFNASTSVTLAGDSLVLAWISLLRSEAAVFEGNYQEGYTLLAQALPRYKALGMTVLVAEALILQGLLHISTGKIAEARNLIEESLRISQEVQDERRITWSKIMLARVALREQQLGETRCLLFEALTWAIGKQDRAMVALGLEGWGNLVATQNNAAWSARVFAVAQAVREATGAPMPLIDQPEYGERIAALQVVLGKKDFKRYWKQGRGMTPQQALVEPVPLPSNSTPVHVEDAGRKIARTGDLTQRELEVLRLVAEGLTNHQIADQLLLRTVTVNAYLRSIYSKLGVSSRTQATRLAYEQRLLS